MEVDPDSDIRIKKEVKVPSDYSLTKGKISLEHILFAVFVFLVVNIIALVFSDCLQYQCKHPGYINSTNCIIRDYKFVANQILKKYNYQ